MLSKNQIRKEGYKAIVKGDEDHQAVYDRLKENDKNKNHFLAKELSKIPSKKIIAAHKTYLHVFVGLMGLILIYRVAALIFLLGDSLQPAFLLLFILGGIIAPVFGIYGGLTIRLNHLQTVSFLFAIMIFRSFQDGLVNTNELYVYIPFVIAIFFGIWLPYKMKTPFSYDTFNKQENGQNISYKDYKFATNAISVGDELLDNDL